MWEEEEVTDGRMDKGHYERHIVNYPSLRSGGIKYKYENNLHLHQVPAIFDQWAAWNIDTALKHQNKRSATQTCFPE